MIATRQMDCFTPRAAGTTVETLGHPRAAILGWLDGLPTASGIRVDERTAMQLSAVWAATRLLSASGGCLPFNLYRPDDNGGARVVADHHVHHMIHFAPNPEMSAMSFRSNGIARQVNRGNMFAEIERDGSGRPLNLWPIHPTNITIGRTDRDELVYKVLVHRGERMVQFDRDDIFHVPALMTKDGIEGIGVLDNAPESLSALVGLQRHVGASVGNGMRPGIVVTHPRNLSVEARKNFRKEWREMYAGPTNANQMALLTEGADIKEISQNAVDSQQVETWQHLIEEVSRWYGVPPHMIAHLLRSTFNNIEHMGIEFVKYSLIPWLKLWEQEVWRKLLTQEERDAGFYAKHVVDALERGDLKTRTESLAKQFMNGALTLNDWLRMEDRNPIGPMGDLRFISLTLTTLENSIAGLNLKSAAAPTEPQRDDDDEETPEPTDEERERERQTAAMLSMHPDLTEEMRASLRQLSQQFTDSIGSLRTTDTSGIEQRLEAIEQRLASHATPVQREYTTEWLDSEFARMLKKECNDIRRAAKRGGNFVGWLDEYYGDYPEKLEAVLLPPMRFATDASPQAMATHVSVTHCRESKRWLLTACGDCTANELADTVAACVAEWPEKRTASQLMGAKQ